MSNPSSAILTESGTNELEIIEFHLEKVLPDGSTKTCYYGIMHLVKRLRDSADYADFPIVMFSSLMSEDNRAKALALGANDTITKPELGRMVIMMDQYIFN